MKKSLRQGKRKAQHQRIKARRCPHGLEYSWCNTDRSDKDGSYDPHYRETNFYYDEPFASSVQNLLPKLGINPKSALKIYHGSAHELLFIKSHGVVARIGRTNVNDLMHPCISQPLGWVEDNDLKINIVLYPGIDLLTSFSDDAYGAQKIDKLRGLLKKTGQKADDICASNIGVSPAGHPLIIDPDQRFVGSDYGVHGDECSAADMARKGVLLSADTENMTMADIHEKAISAVADLSPDLRHYSDFFMSHQPLRRMFWRAQSSLEANGTPNEYWLSRFWDECKALTQAPKSYVMHDYQRAVNDEGVHVTRYQQRPLNNVRLRTPWL